MDVFMRQHMRMNSSEFQLPKEGSIYDYLYDTSRSLRGNQPVNRVVRDPHRHAVVTLCLPRRPEQVGPVDGHGLALRARPGRLVC